MRRSVEDWLDALRSAGPTDPVIAEAFAKAPAAATARAATLVREHAIEGLWPAMLAAYDRLFDDGVQRDPGCHAKLAILDALDDAGHLDPAPFWKGARYRQMEPAWGGPVDTATGVRSRCAAALMRLREDGALDLLVDHLVDSEVVVRTHAAEILGDHGGMGVPAILRLKIRIGLVRGPEGPQDEEPEVVEAALAALIAVAPDAGLALGVELLGSSKASIRQMAGLALGGSRLPAAVEPLDAWFLRAGSRAERQAAFVSLGLLRLPAATAKLLEIVATGPGPDAHAAIEALAIQRGDNTVYAAVLAAAERSRHDLSRAVAEWFG